MERSRYFELVQETAAWLRGRVGVEPAVAVVLSAGLSGFADAIESPVVIQSAEVPHFPRAAAEGHKGTLIFGRMHGAPVVALSGRFHYYEGHAPHEVVFPYFVLHALGVQTLITTNAVGGVRRSFRPGDVMLVRDHINLMGINPLIGIAVQRPADQFTSLTNAYDAGLRRMAKAVARKQKLTLKEGVFLATSGPSYETKAEIAAFRKWGADAVGMSTVPEVIAANFLGMKVLTLSCIANPAADLHTGKMTHAEVLAAMDALAPKVVRLLEGCVEQLKGQR